MTLPMALKQLRAELHLKQKELATLLGTDSTTVNRWETGKTMPKPTSAMIILNLAKDKGVSKLCQKNLHDAFFPKPDTKERVNDLRTTEIAQINTLVNESVNGVIVLDVENYEILYANNKIADMVGVPIEKAGKMKCYEFLMHRDSPCEFCTAKNMPSTDYQEWNYNSMFTGKDYWVRRKAINWGDRKAQIKYVTDTTDISKPVVQEIENDMRVRYERELKLRHELMKDATAYYRINLSNTMVEELYTELMDMSKIQVPLSMEDLIQLGLLEGVYEADKPLFEKMLNPKNMLANYHSGKTAETFYYRRYVPNKGLRWLKGSIAKLKRVSSDDVIAFFTAIDVDDERKEQILLRDVMDEEIESLITIKIKTREIRVIMEDRKLEGYNPYKPITGYFPLTNNFRDSLFDNMVEEDKEGASDFITTKKLVTRLEETPVLQYTYRVYADGGDIRRKKVRAFYLDETKEDLIFVRRDITDLYNEEQRQKEELQKAIDEAYAANQAKSDFLSRMSHDIRTPLNAIIGYSGEILREGATKEQLNEFLDDINASGKYLLGIINDVLDMTKIESQKMVLHEEPYRCGEFIQSIRTVIQPLCDKKGVDFVLDFPDNQNLAFMADKVRFNQIFINILSNAVKFTPEGGQIVFREKNKKLANGKWEEVFSVADTGCGMSKEFIPHAFDSFSQEYEGQKMHKEQGTGLGLSIVKELVELMGGTIEIESELGEGSTFIIKLTMTPELTKDSKDGKQFGKGGLNGLHILLCEDHPMNSQIATKLLEKQGCKVDVAMNGEEGLEKYAKSQDGEYDVILMDVRMPVMDGLEATKKIRELKRMDAHTIPILAMTANAFVEDKRMCIEAGMNAHVSKPINPQEMYQTIYQYTR